MRRLRTALKYTGIVLLLLLTILGAGGTWFIRRPWPQIDGTIDVAGLSAPVEVIRDRWGIPQIYAQNERDLFFAQGYVHAQDRLWQMDFNRRLGYGTVSAVVGEQTVGIDRYVRTMGLKRAAEQELQSLDAESLAILEAYAAGVNAYIAANRGRLPIEFTLLRTSPEPWKPLDTLVWGKVMSWTLSWNQPFELLRARMIAEKGQQVTETLLPRYNDQAALIVPPEVESYSWLKSASADLRDPLSELLGGSNYSQGSNSWVVHGSRTASGKPLLVDETHLDLGMPSIWYQNGLHGGRFNTVGFSFPGVPLVIIGHNDRIAWGITDLPADVQDVYIEKLNSADNPTQYEFRGQWQDLEIVNETIEVRGAEPVELAVRRSRHGPILNDVLRGLPETAPPLALRWTLYDDSRLFGGVVRLNLARNWDEFRQALSQWISPNEHFVYADVDGNIGYQASGAIPLRSAKHQGLVPVPGWTGEYEWQGSLPYDQLLSVYNPPEGFFATANNKVVTPDYRPYLGTEWSDPYRIQRIGELLAADPQATPQEMQALADDTLSLPAQALRQYAATIKAENDLQAQALQQLSQWDLRSEPESVGAAIYHVWHWFLLHDTVGDELGQELTNRYRHFSWIHMPTLVALIEQNSTWLDDVSTTQQEDRTAIMQRSFGKAVSWLSERYGSDPGGWTWGKLHTMTFRQQPLGQSGIAPLEWLFNSRPVPVAGDDFSVNTAWSSWDNPDQPFAVFGGTAQRLVVDLSDLGKTQAINSTGQSGHAFHRHRDDLIPLWQSHQYHALPFKREDITQPEGTLTLRPATP
jgi:penicillin G amidase